MGWAPDDRWKETYDQWKLRSPEDEMNTPDEQAFDDERDHQAQQQVDNEEREYRLTEILRRLAEGVKVSRDDVLFLCAGCGIDKRNVF
jgi:hypothetical protein